ncbi:spore coat protein [Brevibacillus fulvus]|uniref:Spore coat protein n=1 Tax=Brevibacillus fulvus TaxID=1125967 RepID=A0A938XUF3_9BACL|nr:spore coat protein [Brevibacillus fulvus]MBM7590302.1 hypothetical protein [Brevibacillus fulvus]
MNSVMENMTGMNVMTDQVVAGDLLNAAKTGIKNYAVAISEAATPELRAVLRKQMDEEIAFHEKISSYMMQKGWYKPYDMNEQINVVLQAGKAAVNAAQNK